MRTLTRWTMSLGLYILCTTLFAASAETKVSEAYHQWCTTLSTAKNPQNIVKLYAPDATLLPTFSPKILSNRTDEITHYFEKLLKLHQLKCSTDRLIVVMLGDTAVGTGFYTFSYLDEQHHVKKTPARFTFVYRKENQQWMIVHHHSSVLP